MSYIKSNRLSLGTFLISVDYISHNILGSGSTMFGFVCDILLLAFLFVVWGLFGFCPLGVQSQGHSVVFSLWLVYVSVYLFVSSSTL